MDETRLTAITHIEEVLGAIDPVEFSADGGDAERYVHISRVLRRFDYPRCCRRRYFDLPVDFD